MFDQKNDGFTIIEVVMVLAIAGLIFLTVFLALPSLQKSRRDTQRKSDVTKLIAQLETYYGNTGRYPLSNLDATAFISDYIDPVIFSDPSVGPYDIRGITESVPNGHQAYPDLGQVFFKFGHTCVENAGGPGTDQIQHDNAFSLTVVSWTLLEQGGTYCVHVNGG